MSMDSDIDFFAKFGEREADNVRLSNAYLLKGLGYKGLGDSNQPQKISARLLNYQPVISGQGGGEVDLLSQQRFEAPDTIGRSSREVK